MSLTIDDLKPYQREGLDFLLAALDESGARRTRVLADDPGLGKTATGALAASAYAAATGAGGFILCPPSLRQTWADELIKWGCLLSIYMPKRSRDIRPPAVGEVVIIGFDALAALARKSKGAHEAERAAAWQRLRSEGAAWMICDEVQKGRRARSARSLALEQVVAAVRRRYGIVAALSGTLDENTPLDLWVLFVVLGIDKIIFPGGIADFAAHFGGVYDQRSGRWTFPPVPPGGSFYGRLMATGLVLMRATAEVLGELPPKTYKVTLCPVPNNQVALEALLVRALGGPAEIEQAIEIDDIVGRARAQGMLGELSRLRKEAATAKIPTMLRRLDALAAEGVSPIVVYSEHVAPIEELRERPGWRVITGTETDAERRATVEQFQAGELVGIGITSACREGFTFTRSRYFLRVSFSWLARHEQQSEARVWRFGQPFPVTVETLVAELVIERAMLRRLGEGQTRGRETWKREDDSSPPAAE